MIRSWERPSEETGIVMAVNHIGKAVQLRDGSEVLVLGFVNDRKAPVCTFVGYHYLNGKHSHGDKPHYDIVKVLG